MLPWVLLDSGDIPGENGQLKLYQRDQEFSIRTGQYELMNSRVYGSEDALGALPGELLQHPATAHVLIGGLGMGYTLAAVLKDLGKKGSAVMAELVPAVVAWNRGPLRHLAGNPLADKRATLVQRDVWKVITAATSAFDAILLDVDNGPEGLVARANDRLYNIAGLRASLAALRPGGFLAVWSSDDSDAFTRRLRSAGFDVELRHVRARGAAGGARYVIWIGRKKI